MHMCTQDLLAWNEQLLKAHWPTLGLSVYICSLAGLACLDFNCWLLSDQWVAKGSLAKSIVRLIGAFNSKWIILLQNLIFVYVQYYYKFPIWNLFIFPTYMLILLQTVLIWLMGLNIMFADIHVRTTLILIPHFLIYSF